MPSSSRWRYAGYEIIARMPQQILQTERARELLRYGFDDVGLDRIIAQTLTVNVGSRA